jgi:hypothetical protein
MTKIKDCYCHTCDKEYHHLGIARHRAMHRDKKEDCEITFSNGKTYIYHYNPPEPINPSHTTNPTERFDKVEEDDYCG